MVDGPPSNIDWIAGLTRGTLDWTEDKVKQIIAAYKNRDIAFIEDAETVKVIKDQRESEEWTIIQTYVKNKSLRIICNLGLALRAYETQQEKAQVLRDTICRVFGNDGLHIAEAIQNGILTDFIMTRIGDVQSGDLSKQIENALKEAHKYIVFVKDIDKAEERIFEIKTRIYAEMPDTLIIYGCRGAIMKVRKIAIGLNKTLPVSYKFKSNQTPIKIIVVIFRDH